FGANEAARDEPGQETQREPHRDGRAARTSNSTPSARARRARTPTAAGRQARSAQRVAYPHSCPADDQGGGRERSPSPPRSRSPSPTRKPPATGTASSRAAPPQRSKRHWPPAPTPTRLTSTAGRPSRSPQPATPTPASSTPSRAPAPTSKPRQTSA